MGSSLWAWSFQENIFGLCHMYTLMTRSLYVYWVVLKIYFLYFRLIALLLSIFCFTVQLDEVWPFELFQLKLPIYFHLYLSVKIKPNSIMFFLDCLLLFLKIFHVSDCARMNGLLKCHQYWWILKNVSPLDTCKDN